MGLMNPNSPTYRGLEPRCRSARSRVISVGSGAAQRFRPGAATVYGFDAFFNTWTPSSGGLAFEVLSQLTVSNKVTLTVYPASDVAGTGNWIRGTGAGTWFSHVDDQNNAASGTNYIYDNGHSPFVPVGPIDFRGGVGSLAGKRILSVTFNCYAAIGATPGSQLNLFFNLGGSRYPAIFLGPGSEGVGAGVFAPLRSWKFTTNPATGVPWTAAEVDSFITGAGGNSFGVEVPSGPAGNLHYLFGLWLDVTYCDENRVLSAYTTTPGTGPGWVGVLGASGGVALSNNTWYYAVAYSLGNVGTMPILSYPEVLEAAAASDTTKEHRKVYDLAVGDGGQVLTATPTTGDFAPLNLWAANTGNTLNASAWPYAEADAIDVYNGAPAANLGQEITCTAAQTYGGVKLGLAWQSATVRPNAPLIIEVRTTSFTGTVQCTATVDPDDIVSGASRDWQQAFDAAVTPGAAQVFVTIRSLATNGKGWRVFALDTRSDLKFSTMAQAASHFEAETMNGTTDAASLASSTRNTRYDLSVALVQAPAFAGSLTATPAVAA